MWLLLKLCTHPFNYNILPLYFFSIKEKPLQSFHVSLERDEISSFSLSKEWMCLKWKFYIVMSMVCVIVGNH